MGYIFYAFGTLILLSNLFSLYKFNKIYYVKKWYHYFKKVSGKYPIVTDFRSEDDYNLFNKYNMVSLIEFIWVCFGVFSKSWFIFLFILLYSMIINRLAINIRYTIIGKIISVKILLLKIILYSYLIVTNLL